MLVIPPAGSTGFLGSLASVRNFRSNIAPSYFRDGAPGRCEFRPGRQATGWIMGASSPGADLVTNQGQHRERSGFPVAARR